MQVTETHREGLRREYAIKIAAGDLDAKVTEKLEVARRDFQMKGFRKGKAPLSLMRKMFGKSVLGEAMQETIDEAMRTHFDQTQDRPAAQPDMQVQNEGWEEGQDVEVTLTYEALPEIPETDFSTVALEKLTAEVEDGAVQEALDNLAGSAGHFDPKEGAAEDGDQVVIDFVGRVDGEVFEGGEAEEFPLTLGSNQFIPGFEDQLVGAAAGEARDVTVTFPEGYQAAHLAGKEAVFSVTVREVKTPGAAPIDDALAQRFGSDDLEALRGQVQEQLSREYGKATRQIMKRRLMDALDEAVSFDLPAVLVDAEAKQIAHQLWHEEHPEVQGHDHGEIPATEEHRALAERRVKLGLLLADVGNRANIQVTEAEMRQAVFAQARQYPGKEREFVEFVQKNEGMQQQIRAPIFEDKVVDYIFELAQVTETSVSKDELQAAVEALEDEPGDEAPAAVPADL